MLRILMRFCIILFSVFSILQNNYALNIMKNKRFLQNVEFNE